MPDHLHARSFRPGLSACIARARFAIGAAFIGLLGASGALAQANVVATFNNWSVFTSSDQTGRRVCYAAANASQNMPRAFGHGENWLRVAVWAGDPAPVDEPSLALSYTIHPRANVRALIDGAVFSLYKDGSEAFVERDSTQKGMVLAMRRSSSIKVEAAAADATMTSYAFPLAGFGEALDKARVECGFEPAPRPAPPKVTKSKKKSTKKATAKKSTKKPAKKSTKKR